jgi:Uma2 family endonuclease
MAEPLRREAVVETSSGGMSLDEFLASSDEQRREEWVEGEVIPMSPASLEHQDLGMLLKVVLRLYAEHHGLGKVLDAPFPMALREQGRAREPDILFVAREHLDRLAEKHLEGPADLAVEIVSPESLGRDRGDKFAEYEEAGVAEYWIIDPRRKQVEVYLLSDDGLYHPLAPQADGALRSRVLPGFPLRPEWLFRDPLPQALEVARELGLV